MIVSSRYTVLILAILLGGMAALFLWEANNWNTALKSVPEPATFNPGPSSLMRASASSSERKGEAEDRCPASSTMAQDPLSKVCEEFDTPCDVPQGWMSGCPIVVPEGTNAQPVPPTPKKPGKPEPVQLLQ